MNWITIYKISFILCLRSYLGTPPI